MAAGGEHRHGGGDLRDRSQRRAFRTLMRTKGGVTTYYVYGLGLLYEETGGATKTYHYNHQGSAVALTDSSGSVDRPLELCAFRRHIRAHRQQRHTLPTPRRIGRDDRRQRAELHARPLLQSAPDALLQRRPHRLPGRAQLVYLRRQTIPLASPIDGIVRRENHLSCRFNGKPSLRRKAVNPEFWNADSEELQKELGIRTTSDSF